MDRTKLAAALYIRVSTEEQAAEGQSVDAQIEILSQYCKLYDIEIYDIYKDLGVSGKSYKNRLGLQQMLKDASCSKFNMVLVWKISRLSRSLKDLLLILDQLERNEIVFSSYSEKFDTSNAVGRMTLQLLGSIAEFERNTIIDNVKLGLREYARKGGKTGTILGYDNINGRLIINNQEAEIVRLIYKLYTANRMSMSEIAMFLNNQGCKTKRGKDFRKDGISVILNNPAYIGINRHNVGSKDEFQTSGAHQALIDKTEWELAQSLRKSNKLNRPVRMEQKSFILSGKLFCIECDSPMLGFSTLSAAKTYRYYRCKVCGRLIAASKLENKTLDLLHKLFLNNQVIEDALSKINCNTAFEKKEKQLRQIDYQIESCSSQLDKYVALLTREDFNNSTVLLKKVKIIEENLRQLMCRKSKFESECEEQQATEISAGYSNIIESIFQNKDIRSLTKLIDCTIKHIKTSKYTNIITLEFKFSISKGCVFNFVL